MSADGTAGAAGGLLDFDDATRQAYNKAYWASFSPIIGQTFDRTQNPNASTKDLTDKAIQLAGRGYKIDVFIMIGGMDPYVAMRERKDWYGIASETALGETPPDNLSPSLGGSINRGSIKVSYDIADFPPFPVAPVKPPVPGRSPVGPLLSGKVHQANFPESGQFSDGALITVGGVPFKLDHKSIFSPAFWIEQP